MSDMKQTIGFSSTVEGVFTGILFIICAVLAVMIGVECFKIHHESLIEKVTPIFSHD